MKWINKIIRVIITAAMLLCLSACGKREADISSQGNMPLSESRPETAAPSKEEQKDSAEEVKEPEESTKVIEEGSGESSGENAGKEESKVLVAYFSVTGNTKKLAEYAAEIMQADLYEIVPAEPYTDDDLNYNDRNSRTSIEMNDESVKPAISGSVSDMGQYDIVFLGYPIWWGDAPHIMDTFMESYDFSGKIIVPFCTSGSSGIGSSAKELHEYTDESVTWLDGERLKSSFSKEDMADWIRGLSLETDAGLPLAADN